MAARLSALRTGRGIHPINIIFLLLSKPQGLVRPEGLDKLKKPIHLFESRIRDRRSCSTIPLPIRKTRPLFLTITK
jgi:hypothetical protein